MFIAKFLDAWEASAFVKLTLSSPESTDNVSAGGAIRNLKARPVDLKEGRKLSLTECYQKREVTRNHESSDGARLLGEAFSKVFTRAHLFTTTGDFQFRRERSGAVRMKASRPAFTQMPELSHDRRHVLRDGMAVEPFLQKLGVTSAGGTPRPGMAGKLRQVVRFVEILGHLLDDWARPEARRIQVADMGAGKGYLTFALADCLRKRGWDAQVTGVEVRPELVDSGNRLAAELKIEGVRFVHGRIDNWAPEDGLDILVALHACNTATDDALFKGIRAGAGLIVTSPCCHQEVRPQMRLPGPLAAAAGHGILMERQAEILTDALRAQLMEMSGYNARVFEFVEPEHSGKNLMLAGVLRRSGGRSAGALRTEFNEMWTAFGLETQRLAALLGEVPR